jgi:hypothetical protein
MVSLVLFGSDTGQADERYREWVLKKSGFLPNSHSFGGYKISGKLSRSIVGLPNAKFFRAFSGERVFQQTRLYDN